MIKIKDIGQEVILIETHQQFKNIEPFLRGYTPQNAGTQMPELPTYIAKRGDKFGFQDTCYDEDNNKLTILHFDELDFSNGR